MTSPVELPSGIVRIAPFTAFVQRFEDLLASSTRLALYFIHSRRWRENHDAAIKTFLAREGTTLEVFLPDLENHELMYSLGKHFDDGPQIPGLITDAYRYFARLARDYSSRRTSGSSAPIPPSRSTASTTGRSWRSTPTRRPRKTCRRSRSRRTPRWAGFSTPTSRT